jgi:hypothetical protein
MKKVILMSLTLLFFSSCYVTMKKKTQNYQMEVRAFTSYENGSCQYLIKGFGKSRLKGSIIIVDTVGKYNLGDKFVLVPK